MKEYKLNWKYLAGNYTDTDERVEALMYLIRAMNISISEKIYDNMPAEGKRFFLEK